MFHYVEIKKYKNRLFQERISSSVDEVIFQNTLLFRNPFAIFQNLSCSFIHSFSSFIDHSDGKYFIDLAFQFQLSIFEISPTGWQCGFSFRTSGDILPLPSSPPFLKDRKLKTLNLFYPTFSNSNCFSIHVLFISVDV